MRLRQRSELCRVGVMPAGRDGMEWDGMGWDGCMDGVGWDKMGWDGMR